MDERQAFLLSILEDPGDANRLVFADWLDEHGEAGPAGWFRQARGPVAVAWAVIHHWLARHHPTMLSLLHGPADEAHFGRLERWIGQAMPEDFKASYRIHDGSEEFSGVVIGLQLMPLAEIGFVWQTQAEMVENGYTFVDIMEGCFSHPAGAVKPLYANRGWVPFAGDIQNHVAIDFDPGPEGKIGQIINCGWGDLIRHVIADTFAGFLTLVARQFVLGRVVLTEDEPPNEPRWLGLAGGRKDLLTGLRGLLGLDGSR
jgi:uncharacterized protein (TIGR02996 family)